jgi:hypothetical protein
VERVPRELTLEDRKRFERDSRGRCSGTLADLKIVKMNAATGGASVLGHTYGLMTTSVPSIQRGSGSSRTTKELQQHDGVVWWRTKRPWLRQADGREVEQREEGERIKCVLKRELPPLHI